MEKLGNDLRRALVLLAPYRNLAKKEIRSQPPGGQTCMPLLSLSLCLSFALLSRSLSLSLSHYSLVTDLDLSL